MIVVAIDTTSRPGSVALMRDQIVLAERAGDPARSASQRLPGEIRSLLDDGGLQVRDVDLFAVASGPGSFTGLRAGIATVQGLALANARLVVAVSALDALAFQAIPHPPARVAAWIDAQRGQIFAALYGTASDHDHPLDPSTGLAELESPMVGTPVEVLARWQHRLADRSRVVFAGSGADAYRSVVAGALGTTGEVDPVVPLLAAAVARIAVVRAALGGATAPHAIVPVYVRRPDAEIARERRDGHR